MDSWQELIDERGDEVSVSPGRLNTWIVFGYLAGEMLEAISLISPPTT
jgi:hypothetical protein